MFRDVALFVFTHAGHHHTLAVHVVYRRRHGPKTFHFQSPFSIILNVIIIGSVLLYRFALLSRFSRLLDRHTKEERNECEFNEKNAPVP